ncbi:hypothetical protein EVAR_37244_1 [Eumeta japonica]|uniref:Uncharacterized protein n=1 Tax=Eumeta variegata TaxID=151549 RepID=A0A4C1Y974_EUMVA|nr:hypothetical protein EVAR_37244_1 [Eumeta japonica]
MIIVIDNGNDKSETEVSMLLSGKKTKKIVKVLYYTPVRKSGQTSSARQLNVPFPGERLKYEKTRGPQTRLARNGRRDN